MKALRTTTHVMREKCKVCGKRRKHSLKTTLKDDRPNRCCGFGGVTMQTGNYRFTKAAPGLPKAAMIKETGAEYVSAECSACRMQLGDAMHGQKVDVIFKTPIELIAKALRE